MTHHKLVIAEKPSVAQSIAAVLGAKQRHDGYLSGNGYLVSWCFGHLAELAGADVYDEKYAKWRYDDLPILPAGWRFTLKADKAKQFELLRDLMRREDVTEVINACDAGREGELIFRTVYYMAGCTKTMKRLWISSMEDEAIRKGFADLRPGREYDGLHQSALCRARADWLVGINTTRLFSVLYHRTLNVGARPVPDAGAHRPAGGGDRRLSPGSLLRSEPSLRRFCRSVRIVQRESGGGRPRRRLRRSAGHGQDGAAHGKNGERAPALRPDRPPAGGQPHVRLYRTADA